MSLISRNSTRRGDTLIEVMFAVGFFALVAIISIAVMNSGINSAERDLELVTARNELNAQAEALRFIHSSYISEKTLPDSNQQYKDLWEEIVKSSNVVEPNDAEKSGLLSIANFGSCSAIYDSVGGVLSPLSQVNAFVINTRDVSGSVADSYISIKNRPGAFRPTELSSRIIFGKSAGVNTSDGQLVDSSYGSYFDRVRAVEGIWDFVVPDDSSSIPKYYDFYIQTCWYGPRALRPTVLDTVIRLYNPEGV